MGFYRSPRPAPNAEHGSEREPEQQKTEQLSTSTYVTVEKGQDYLLVYLSNASQDMQSAEQQLDQKGARLDQDLKQRPWYDLRPVFAQVGSWLGRVHTFLHGLRKVLSAYRGLTTHRTNPEQAKSIPHMNTLKSRSI